MDLNHHFRVSSIESQTKSKLGYSPYGDLLMLTEKPIEDFLSDVLVSNVD
jgi:hypothetical protein